MSKVIVKGLYNVQQKLESIGKDAKNPHFKNRYVTLDKLINTIKPLCLEQGLLLTQTVFTDELGIRVDTQLHSQETGETMSFDGVTVKADRANPQGYGSAVTYARRYSLSTVFMVTTDEDDDANVASGRDFFMESIKKFLSLSPIDASVLRVLISSTKTDEKKVVEYLGTPLDELSAEQVQKAFDMLMSKVMKMNELELKRLTGILQARQK